MRVPGCTREYMTAARSRAYRERTATARRKTAARAARRVEGEGVRPIPSAKAAALRQREGGLIESGSLLPGHLLLESAPAAYNLLLAMPLTVPSASFLSAHAGILVFLVMGVGF